MDVVLVRADIKDAKLILDGQREAFSPTLERYHAGDLDPANEILENIEKAIEQAFFYKILADGEFAGAIMIEQEGPRRLKLHTVYVKSELWNRGIAGRAIDIAERLHADAAEWTLNTPADLANNRHLYEKKGYVKRGETKINDALTLIYYGKAGHGATLYEAAQNRDTGQRQTLILKCGQKVKTDEEYDGPEGWKGWLYCTGEDGVSGWAPEGVIDEKSGTVKEDYSSFELSIEKGEKLRGLRETGGWIWCENAKGERGWVPVECLKRV